MKVKCPICNRVLDNKRDVWRCLWCTTPICVWCYATHTMKSHPEKVRIEGGNP